jgi:hypothetical protein
MKKAFWRFLVVFSFLFFLPGAAFANPPDTTPAAEDNRSHEEKDKILTCPDVSDCIDKARAQTKRVHTWKSCDIMGHDEIVFGDGKYTVKETADRAVIEQNACICPEKYSLSRTVRLTRIVKNADGGKTEYYEMLGVCLPQNTEPNATVIAEGLNRLLEFAAETKSTLGAQGEEITKVTAIVDGHELQINLNTEGIKELREQLGQLEGRVDRNEKILESMCADSNAPKGVRDLCNAVQRLGRDRQIFVIGVAGTYSRYPGRNHAGVALEGGWITPPLSEGSPLRLELRGRLGIGSSGEMKQNGNSALGLEGTIAVGPVVDLDDDGRYKLHLRGMGQQLMLMDGFKAMGRRYGGEVAFSFCPKAEANSQGSFCVVPHVNLTHGSSAFPRTPTEENPSPPMRRESGVTMGAGIGILGQF